MKLKTRFSLVAILCGIEMILLSTITMIGTRIIQKMQTFQYNELECQYGVADIINFLNQGLFWSIDTTTINTDWKTRVISTNKKFRELQENPITKFFKGDVENNLINIQKTWQSIVAKLNPINGHFKSIQDIDFTEEEISYSSRYGIKACKERFPDSEAIESANQIVLIIEIQMKDLIKDGIKLQGQMKIVNEEIKEVVEHYSTLYRIVVVIVGVIFFALMIYSILLGTVKVINNIKRVHDLSKHLAQKDFTVELKPQGSNEMETLMKNMNDMVSEINSFFIVVKKTAAKAISSGYSINDSSISTAAATNEINNNIEKISNKFEQINLSVAKTVQAISEIDSQVKTLVNDNNFQSSAIEESSSEISTMADELTGIKENAEKRTQSTEEMRGLVADSETKIHATSGILSEVMNMLDEIGEVINIIDGVTEQTNLLSMNAAIESAHAGEFGKGFAVVAEEIRSLAESTSENSKKINEAITNVINKVTEANISSCAASESFAKISSHSEQVISSFKEISIGIENLNTKTRTIATKTEQTALTAEKISKYCENLATQQDAVSSEINSISDLFSQALDGIREIRNGTEDIVQRMAAVGEQSKESYKNMTDLENILEQFKTTSDDSQELKEEIDNSKIENIISPELQVQVAADFNQKKRNFFKRI